MKQQGDLSVPSPAQRAAWFSGLLDEDSAYLQGVFQHGDCVEWIIVFSGHIGKLIPLLRREGTFSYPYWTSLPTAHSPGEQ